MIQSAILQQFSANFVYSSAMRSVQRLVYLRDSRVARLGKKVPTGLLSAAINGVKNLALAPCYFFGYFIGDHFGQLVMAAESDFTAVLNL